MVEIGRVQTGAKQKLGSTAVAWKREAAEMLRIRAGLGDETKQQPVGQEQSMAVALDLPFIIWPAVHFFGNHFLATVFATNLFLCFHFLTISTNCKGTSV